MVSDHRNNRSPRISRGCVAALAAALSCHVYFADGAAFAQQQGLRGTFQEAEAQATSPLKPKRRKALLEAPGSETPVQAYEPLAQSDDDVLANDIPIPGTAPVSATAAGDEPADPLVGAQAPLADEPIIARAAPLESEVPSPVTRVSSDGELEGDLNGPAGTDNERTGAIEGKDAVDESDPYAAPGIRSGAFVLRPTFEAGFRYFTNPNDPACNCFVKQAETTSTMRAESDWLRHQLNLELRGTVQKPLNNPNGSDLTPDVGTAFRLAADGRIDISVDDTVTLSSSAERARESLTSDSSTGYISSPIVTTLRAGAGYTHDAGLIGLGISGSVVKTNYGDAIDLGGVTRDQSDRDNVFASVTLRGTYDLSAALSPFAEIELGRRIFDNETDAAGQQNSATRYAARVGAAFNNGEKLTGELAGGWFTENVDDPALQDVSGVDMRGSVNWSPVRDTTIAFVASTAVEGARSISSETSVLYNGSATLTRKLRANLDGTLLLGASLRDYTGSLDSLTTLTAEAGATWWFNRNAGLNSKLTYSHSSAASIDPVKSYGAYVGVILRR